MFSIVIPLFNKRHTVAATVETVIGQSGQDFELLVVDDGSTDGGADLVSAFRDPRIRIVTQTSKGPGPARNAGIEAARHDWIAFLDADDLWLPDHLAELDRIRRLFPEAGLIGTSFARRGRGECDPLAGEARPEVASIDYFDRMARGRRVLMSSSVAIPRATYQALGGFLLCEHGEDTEYWARVALDRPVATSSRVTAIYRLGTGGMTDQTMWTKRETAPTELADLGPFMALLVERHPTIEDPKQRASVDRYIDHRLSLAVRTAARAGDIATLHALPRLFPRPPGPGDRAILAAAHLPALLAGALYALGFGVKRLLRRLKRNAFAPSPIPFKPREAGIAS